jgi:hypothetical protein
MEAESRRLGEARNSETPRMRFGPYLSEGKWGTVCEDYSDYGAGLGASHQTGWTGIVEAKPSPSRLTR